MLGGRGIRYQMSGVYTSKEENLPLAEKAQFFKGELATFCERNVLTVT